MLGIYEHFPDIYHGSALFSSSAPSIEIEKILLTVLHRLNQNRENLSLPGFVWNGIDVEVNVGIADDLTFSYIDEEILHLCLRTLSETVFSTLDFLFIVKYYVPENGNRKPLRFDYYIVRFTFRTGEVEILVYHEKGTRRLAVEDLIMFIMEEVNRELKKRKKSSLKKIHLRAV